MENNNDSQIDPNKVENLHKLLAVFDTERLTPKDFVGAFKQVVEHVKKTQNLTVQHLTAITQSVNAATSKLSGDNQSQFSLLRDELTKSISDQKQNLDTSHTTALSRLETAIAGIQNGKDADEDMIVDKVLTKLPPPAAPLIGEDFRNHLEALRGDDRLDKSAIRGLDDLEKKVNNHSVVIGNNPGVQLDAGSGIVGRFQTLKFPGATITTSNVDASITVSGTPISLTTTGTSGAATLVGTVLNIPQYSAGGGSGITRSINSVSTITTAGAAALTDYVYLCSGTTTLTMPTAISNSNRYTIKNVGNATITVATTSAQTIDGSASATLPVKYSSIDLISDGSNWAVV